MSKLVRYFTAIGNVQRVMFRQTLVRSAIRRGIEAGASRTPNDRAEVSFTLVGNNKQIQEIVTKLKQKKNINNLGAKVLLLREFTSGKEVQEHEVHSGNYLAGEWDPDVKINLLSLIHI
eukprot:TRINITY_DN9390_c0_g1_i2.p1 TRINITY_DN9390_c0_g1~~TRINITY_DN9390_c0_g1_i2.p1  ORF type:complete len:119 (-),score=15.82 TRINITY_DN9390_c0_g1_i2:22-378(-)